MEYWNSISSALRKTNALKHLNIFVNGPFDTSNTWIFEGCEFQLRSFHCDLNWNDQLVNFLYTQVNLHDLFLIDYNESSQESHTATSTVISSSIPIPTERPDTTTLTNTKMIDNTQFLPNLSKLECTFSEAALALVPNRPVTHLKTCFSRSDATEKRAELYLLFSRIRRSTRRLRSLDIADSSYTEAFSMEMLRTVVATGATSAELRYLGTVVLPIGGQQRLKFYGLLMRLPRIACVEFEVTEWDPSPLATGAPAFKALANELRLYCPTVTRVIFVHDFERTVISYTNGVGKLDLEISPEILWRDV
uniref:F-box domain-containing protein n=1 Tax=Moniliophthora roreri TaxID=221103 RepID=A0A0W0F6E3_MONRR